MHPISGLDLLLEIHGDDGSAFGLPLHVSARSSPLYPGLLYAFGIVAYECGEDEVGGGFSTELTFIVIEVDCHVRDM